LLRAVVFLSPLLPFLDLDGFDFDFDFEVELGVGVVAEGDGAGLDENAAGDAAGDAAGLVDVVGLAEEPGLADPPAANADAPFRLALVIGLAPEDIVIGRFLLFKLLDLRGLNSRVAVSTGQKQSIGTGIALVFRLLNLLPEARLLLKNRHVNQPGYNDCQIIIIIIIISVFLDVQVCFWMKIYNRRYKK